MKHLPFLLLPFHRWILSQRFPDFESCRSRRSNLAVRLCHIGNAAMWRHQPHSEPKKEARMTLCVFVFVLVPGPSWLCPRGT